MWNAAMCLLVKSILVNEHLLIERSSSHMNNGTLLSQMVNPRNGGDIWYVWLVSVVTVTCGWGVILAVGVTVEGGVKTG